MHHILTKIFHILYHAVLSLTPEQIYNPITFSFWKNSSSYKYVYMAHILCTSFLE